MGCGFSRKLCPNVHDWGQVCRFQGKIGRSFRSFTTSSGILAHKGRTCIDRVGDYPMSPVMTPEQFHTWSQQLQLPLETEALITAIRGSSPVRRVRGRTNNVTGRYPSPKTGRSIQFESQVEFVGIYGMERDNDVLEYYDQSSRIPLGKCRTK